MKVLIAENPAFCYGVERAYSLVKKQKNSRIFTWGPLIHNPQIVDELKSWGILAINSLSELLEGDTVILRAHGVSEKVKTSLKKRKIKIIDGTCPFVTKAHLIANNFIKNGKKLIVLGNKNHPEIKGICEDFPEAVVIHHLNEVDFLEKELTTDHLGIMCQTTIRLENVKKMIERIKKINPNLVFENTICNATENKQNSAKKLAKQVDVMLVVGGKNSNNTKMLQQICSQFCPSYLVSEIKEVKQEWLQNSQKIGITGGASTPIWLIENLRKTLLQKFA